MNNLNVTNGPLHLLLLSDNVMLAQSLEAALQQEPLIGRVTFVYHIDLGSQLPVYSSADVVVADVDSVSLELEETVAQLKSYFPALPIVALGSQRVVDSIVDLIEAGATGCLLKTASMHEFVTTVESAHDGKSHCDCQVTGGVLQRIRALASGANQCQSNSNAILTSREQEILKLISAGLLNKEIARHLGIAVSTVKNHVHRILKKLNVHTRRDAARQRSDRPTSVEADKRDSA